MSPTPIIDELFALRAGTMHDGFPAIHASVNRTAAGTRYLQSPGVVLLARPQTNIAGIAVFLAGFDRDLGFDDYVADPTPLPASAQLCKVAGQTCYLAFGPKRTTNANAKKYFDNVKESGHGSVLEHASFSFLLYGVSRSFTHELVRHRAGTGFSQTSQRYVDGKVLRFVERPEYQSVPGLHARFEAGIDRAATEYAERTEFLLQQQTGGASLLSGDARTDLRKKVQQAARSSLPNETEAPVVFSANARALRHIIEMRASRHAEIEIREVFLRVLLCVAKCDPILFEDYSVEALPDGTYGATTQWRKV